MARTSSLNCLSYRNPYQTPHSLNCLPLFVLKNPFFVTEKWFVASPSQKSALGAGKRRESLKGIFWWPARKATKMSRTIKERSSKSAKMIYFSLPVLSTLFFRFSSFQGPKGPRIEKIQSREAILKKSSFQYGMKLSIENEIFIPGPSPAAEKQGLRLKFSIENEIFKPRMKISSENENFVRGGMVFFMRSSENEFFRSPGPLGVAQELNRNRKPEPLEPFSQEPKAEPEPPEPFSGNRNRNRNRPLC